MVAMNVPETENVVLAGFAFLPLLIQVGGAEVLFWIHLDSEAWSRLTLGLEAGGGQGFPRAGLPLGPC